MTPDPDEDFDAFVRRQRERMRALHPAGVPDEPRDSADDDDFDDDDDEDDDEFDEKAQIRREIREDRAEEARMPRHEDMAAMAKELLAGAGRVVKPTSVRQRLVAIAKEPPLEHKAPVQGDRAWAASPRLTRTEVGLRLALHLLRERIARGDVAVALTGAEMSGRAKRPLFPVDDFLAAQKCERVTRGEADDPDAAYFMVEGAEHRIALSLKPTEAPLWCALPGRARLLVDVMSGSMSPTRSSAEHTQLRTALGRLITLPDVRKNDVLAVAMPRSARFRQLVGLWRLAPKVVEARVRLLLVDRARLVDGLKGISRRLD